MITPEQVIAAIRRTEGTQAAVGTELGVPSGEGSELDRLMRSMAVSTMIRRGPFGRYSVVGAVRRRELLADDARIAARAGRGVPSGPAVVLRPAGRPPQLG